MLTFTNIFNYKTKEFAGTIKVGFPVTSENKVLSKLDELKINYLVYDKEIIKGKFNKNNYFKYLNGPSNLDRINLIYKKLLGLKSNNIDEILNKIEVML